MSEEGKNYTRVHIGTTEDGEFEILFAEEGDMEPQEALGDTHVIETESEEGNK